MTNQQKRRIIALRKQGHTLQEIAGQEGFASVFLVHQFLKEARVKRGTLKHSPAFAGDPLRERNEQMRSLYEEGDSISDLADEFGLSRRRVSEIVTLQATNNETVISARVTPSQREYLKRLGAGNISAAIHSLLQGAVEFTERRL